MKRYRFASSLIALIFALLSIPISPSFSETRSTGEEIFRVVDTRNRDLDGVFYDRTLEERLLPTGTLGVLLERARTLPTNRRILFIDPMLIEEVSDLSDGFLLAPTEEDVEDPVEVEPSEIALAWLSRLDSLTNSDAIAAINYGNPDLAFLTRSAPSELRIHHELSRQRLAELLSRSVSPVMLTPGAGVRISPYLAKRFTDIRRDIRSINSYADNPETRELRLLTPLLINPSFEKERAFEFARDLTAAINKYRNSIRITSGRYTLTSKRERVPVTVINDFSNDLEIRLRVRTSNTRVLVGAIDPITIAAQSKLQIEIPVEVLSSGSSDLIISMRVKGGERVGKEVRLPLTLAVISPVTTWITTGSGVILLLAAVVQSLRRVRRSRLQSREKFVGESNE
jgi:hypothetical protein